MSMPLPQNVYIRPRIKNLIPTETHMQAEQILYRIQYILDCHDHALHVQCSHAKRDRGEELSPGASEAKRGRGDDDLWQKIQLLKAENQRLNGIIEAVKKEIPCAMCLEPSVDDVVLECGHNFCRTCVVNYQNKGGIKCAMCRKPTEPTRQLQHLGFMRVVEAVRYTKVYDNGEKYTGELQDGKRHGQGTCFYPNGNKYEGGWQEDSMFGPGVYTWKDGSVYRGEFLEGSKSARGVMTWADGQRYEGTWRYPYRRGPEAEFLFFDPAYVQVDEWFIARYAGDVCWHRHGDGVHTWPDGRRMQADFNGDDRNHGPGQLTWRNGDRLTWKRWNGDGPSGVAEYVWHDGCRLFEVNAEYVVFGMEDASICLDEIVAEPRFDRDLQHHAGSYKGPWIGSDWRGHGKLVYPLIGFEYEGDLVESTKDGHGKATYGSGSTYEGEWHDDMKEGRGVYTWPDGRRYEGQYSGNQKNGQGVLTWPDGGGRYEGEWQDEKYHGQGKLTKADGSTYEGAWYQGLRHGRGKTQTVNGSSYEGEWKNDKKHGFGVDIQPVAYIYVKYEGEWQDNKMHGFGIMTYLDGSTYEGEWKDNRKHGKGIEKEKNGDYFQGQFRTGYREGRGHRSSAKLGDYDGEWHNGWQEGRGTQTWPNQDRYEGEFYRDQKQGQGAMRYANGDQYQGSWSRDKKKGRGKMTPAGGGAEEAGIWYDDKRLPDASSLDTDGLVLLIFGLPPEIAKEVLSDFLYLRVLEEDDKGTHSYRHPPNEAKRIVEFILAGDENYKIVNMLRDEGLFRDAFEEAENRVGELSMIEEEVDMVYDSSDLTVVDKLTALERKVFGSASSEGDILNRLNDLSERLEISST